MRKILTLLTTLVLSTAASTSIIACQQTIPQKWNLNDFTINEINEYLNGKDKYKVLNNIIFKNIMIFNYFPLKDGYQIKYYHDQAEQIEITNELQSAGEFYFTISAANDDPYWSGTTKVNKIKLNKHNLWNSHISSILIKLENGKAYEECDTLIKTEFNEWNYGYPPIANKCQIKYYRDEAGQIEITNEIQSAGEFYFTISAANDDPNWEGISNKIKLTLVDKFDLNKHLPMTNITATLESGKKYHDFDIYLIVDANNWNTAWHYPLIANNCQIKYYRDEAGQIEITNEIQSAGEFYFTISAANDDPNWEGISNKIKLTLVDKFDLNKHLPMTNITETLESGKK